MDMLRLTAFLLMVFCILRNTTAQDLQATCPTGGFTEGQESQVNCSVNRLYFANQCQSTPSVVLFVFKPLGGSDVTWCSTEYQNCASTGTSASACNNCTCKCLEDTTNTSVYSLTFVPESRYTNGSFICEIPCFGQNPATDFTSCEKFPVATTTTAATLATTTGAVPPTRSTSPSASQGFGGGETGGLPLPVIIVIPIAIVVILGNGVAFIGKKSKKVFVGDKREQIWKIDKYAIKLDSSKSKSQLNNIAQEDSCCCISPAKISVDGFRSLHDGKPKDDPKEQLHVLISIKLAFCGLLNKKETQVEEFLKREVTPYIIGIVETGEICIPEHNLKDIGEETGVTIVPPAVNAQGRTVIQIEGETRKSVDEAKQKVEEFLQRDVTPHIIEIVETGDICIPEKDLKEIGKKTGVTIVPPDVNAQGRTVIQIEGKTRKSVDEAIQKVKDLIQTIKGSKCPSHDPYCQNP